MFVYLFLVFVHCFLDLIYRAMFFTLQVLFLILRVQTFLWKGIDYVVNLACVFNFLCSICKKLFCLKR